MKAYAILDGGGVKGAALAGCLKAAEELGIEFVAYGGTSAGSIVALLAAVGYSGEDMRRMMVEEVTFTSFLDDGGRSLERLKSLPTRLDSRVWGYKWFKRAWVLFWHRHFFQRMNRELGLYDGHGLKEFLIKKIGARHESLRNPGDITFHNLQRAGCKPLKIVASDIGTCRPVVFSGSGNHEINGPLLDAIRASISYPFVFKPVHWNDRYLVDGGLSSNLPVFLFERERRDDGLPLIAFDLVVPPDTGAAPGPYGLREFGRDMLSMSLEAGDHLMQQLIPGLYHVRVEIPAGINAMDFGLSQDRRSQLFDRGYATTHSYFRTVVPHWAEATDEVQGLQAVYAEPGLIKGVLQTIAEQIENNTRAEDVRCSIMLPTGHGTRRVVYQYGMDTHPDNDLELPMDAGCSGQAWTTRKPVIADIDKAKLDPPRWKMTSTQQNKVEPNRRAMLCVPIFNLRAVQPGKDQIEDLPILATLGLDSSTALAETNWMEDKGAVAIAQFWADVMAKLLV